MDLRQLKKRSQWEWVIEPHGRMRVEVVIYADETLMREMDDKVAEQAANVASLPGIVRACYVMPDAHWGYGFPIGGVAAFDAEKGGVISAGGVGFDIACGVRLMTTGITIEEAEKAKRTLAELLSRKIPAGVGSTGTLRLNASQMDEMLMGGAQWAVEKGYGMKEDLRHIEEDGVMKGAKPRFVSDEAKKRQRDEVGTLGSGNHYLEVQKVSQVYDETTAELYGLREGEVVISVHCGSRGLGHQIGTDFLKRMVMTAPSHGIELPDRELACAPIESEVGQQYLGAMRAGINCALANRQVLTHLLREGFAAVFPKAELKLLYDVSHNTCKEEVHEVNGKKRPLFVHRKGATRSFGGREAGVPEEFREVGQPVLIGGTMGTASYVLAGTDESISLAYGSSCHGAGRSMSRHEATKRWHGREVVLNLERRGILVRSPSMRGVAEEAPDAYKNVNAVVDAAHNAKLSRKVAKLTPLVCVKG